MTTVDGSATNGTRKRIKISEHEAMAAGERSTSHGAHSNGHPCQHEQDLKSLHTDIDSMRHLVTCQICHRFMYEPFALSCGHTYCYSCLSQWLPSNVRKTCPDCRAVITQEPTPSYVIRELVLIFTSRDRLLPAGESLEEHHTIAKEEADVVAKDRANINGVGGGLFKGCFKRIPRSRSPMAAFHDHGDDVLRCPECYWEVEDGHCANCGIWFDEAGVGFSDYDGESLESDENDEELDELDEEDGFTHTDDGLAHPGFYEYHGSDGIDADVFAAAFGEPRHLRSTNTTSEYSDDEDEVPDSEMDRFIDDDEEDSEDDESESSGSDISDGTEVQRVASRPPFAYQRRAPVVVVDDEEAPNRSTPEGDSESEDEDPVAVNTRRSKHRTVLRQRPIVNSSDEEEAEPDHHAGRSTQSNTRSTMCDFSPLENTEDSAAASANDSESDVPSEPASAANEEIADEESQDELDQYDATLENPQWNRPSATPSVSAAVPEPRHRLGTGLERRNRHADVREPPRNVNATQPRTHGIRTTARRPPANPIPPPTGTRAPATRTAQPTHPFQLANTLASINDSHRRERTVHNRTHDFPTTGSAASSQSGGVDVRSNDSSDTIGPDPVPASPSDRTKLPVGRRGRAFPHGQNTRSRYYEY